MEKYENMVKAELIATLQSKDDKLAIYKKATEEKDAELRILRAKVETSNKEKNDAVASAVLRSQLELNDARRQINEITMAQKTANEGLVSAVDIANEFLELKQRQDETITKLFGHFASSYLEDDE